MSLGRTSGIIALNRRYVPKESSAGRSSSLQQAFGAARPSTRPVAYSSVSNIGSQMGNMLGRPTSGVISPMTGNRTGVMPPSTLASARVIGGRNGGSIGPAATTTTPTPLGAATLTGLNSSVGKMGVDITNTLGSLVPLAIKIILAVIVIKIVWGLISGRKR